MLVVSIEFDQAEFKTRAECLEWLTKSIYSSVLEQKGFQIRSRKAACSLTWEKRPVFYYIAKDIWRQKKLSLVRPARGVCVELGETDVSLLYQEHEIPEYLPETKLKLSNAEFKRQQKEKERLEKEEAKKRKRSETKGKKKSPKRRYSPKNEFAEASGLETSELEKQFIANQPAGFDECVSCGS